MDREQLKKDLAFMLSVAKQEAASIGRITVAVWIVVLLMMLVINIYDVITQ